MKIHLTRMDCFSIFMVTNIGYHNIMEKNVLDEILKALQASPQGLQMEEISEKLGLTRHTVAKYLEVLRAEGKIHFKKVGHCLLIFFIAVVCDAGKVVQIGAVRCAVQKTLDDDDGLIISIRFNKILNYLQYDMLF